MRMKIFFCISVVFFTFLLFVSQSATIPSDLGNTLLTVLSFLFGIIGGFYIVVTTTDYNHVKDVLASETAGWISLYHTVLVYDKDSAPKLADLIDVYVRRQFDFEVIEYAKSSKEFNDIEDMIRGLPVRFEASSQFQTIQTIMHELVTARQQMTVLGTRTLSNFQWSILITLGILFVYALYSLRSGALFFDIATVAISSSVVLLLLLIRDLDLYIWNERTFSFDIFENVLRSIGQIPYYPAETLAHKRIVPTEEKYRVGILLNRERMERRIEVRTRTV